jgi:tetratricopeptide (TPR) repeat protein
MVKGKTEPLRTYLVQQARPARFRTVTRGVAGIDTPTFGRQAELDQLRSAYDEVVEQQSVKWLQLIGEAGVGKSRLLAEMRAYFPQCTPAYHLFKGRAYPGDESQAYAIPRRMWLDYFHIPEDSPPEDIEAQWKAAIQALLPFNQDEAWLAEAAHALGFLLGLPIVQPNLYTVQPDQLKNLSFLISRQLLLPLRQSDPLVLLLEDVQWLDQASWEYLYDLFLEAATSQGLLILATSRQDWSPPPELQAHPAYCELTVDPLTPSACGQLTHSLLKDIRGVPEKVIQRIIQRAEGIPYFVEEMVNWLLDLGVIDQSVQPWQFVAEKYDPALLPDTLQHLLQTRLDNLDTQSKTILQYGSVLGRRFWESWLEAQFACPCQEPLQALQARGFIMQSSKVTFEDETEWRFSHQVQQEVAYASMLKRQRKDLHQAAVEWLEWRAGKSHRLDEFAGPIGDHAREAGYLQKASAWYLRAGNHAKQRGALAEARHYYESALRQLPDHDLERRWPILLEHDEVLGFLSDTQARLVEDELLVSLAQQSGQEAYLAEAYFRQGSYLFNLGDYQKAVDLLRPAYQHAINIQDNALASRAASMHMINLVRLGQTKEAYYWVEQAQELSGQCRDDLTQAMVLNNLSLYYTFLGDHFQSAQLINQQVMLTRKMKHRMGEARGLGNLGYTYILLGLFSIGIVTLEQALELTNVYGMQQDAAYAQLNLGLAYLRVKDFTSARQELETAMRHLDVMQDQFGLAAGKLYLGLAYEQHGDFQAAQDWFYQAAQVCTRLSIPSSAMDCQAGLARCALMQGDLPSAEALVRELWVYLREHQAIALEFPFLAYQTCIMVFEQCRQFQQMSEALRTGYELLVEKANRISEFTWREVYLQEIPENQWIFNQMSIHQQSQS